MSGEVSEGSIRCEHCGNVCTDKARWCPSCGRRLPAKGQEDSISSPEGPPWMLAALLLAMIIACLLVWRLMAMPMAIMVPLLLAVAPGRYHQRIIRCVAAAGGCILAALIIFLATPRLHKSVPHNSGCGFQVGTGQSQNHGYDPYVQGRVLARFKDGQADTICVSKALKDVARSETSNGECSLHFRLATTQRQVGSDKEIFTEQLDPDTHDVTIGFDSDISVSDVVSKLSEQPEVVFVEPDYIYHSLRVPDDPYFDEPYDTSREGPLDQWWLRTIQAPEAWDTLKDVRSDVKLAIIDTGVDPAHPDMVNVIARNSKGQLLGKSFVRGKKTFDDDNGHGTHSAGIAAAETDNGIGVAGVGYRSFRIVPAKVLTSGGYGEIGFIKNAIVWAADQGCRVESLSLGGSAYSQALQDAINYAWSKGVLVVAASGNEGQEDSGYPASNNHVFAVGATDREDHRAWFSNYGTPIAVVAPGVGILSTMPSHPCFLSRKFGIKQNYDALSGTSMACPVVAGCAAALFAMYPTMTAAEVARRLQQTADNVSAVPGGGWCAQLGYGRINLNNAISGKVRPCTTGSLYGQVTDSSGNPLAHVQIICDEITIETAANGMFRIANLPDGKHTVKVVRGNETINATSIIYAGADTDVTFTISRSRSQIL